MTFHCYILHVYVQSQKQLSISMRCIVLGVCIKASMLQFVRILASIWIVINNVTWDWFQFLNCIPFSTNITFNWSSMSGHYFSACVVLQLLHWVMLLAEFDGLSLGWLLNVPDFLAPADCCLPAL